MRLPSVIGEKVDRRRTTRNRLFLLLTGTRRHGNDGAESIEESGTRTVAKHDLGTKRICTGCGTKFYDFNRSPAVCPKCETVYRETARAAAPAAAAKAAAPAARKAEVEEVGGPEIVSLEDAEKEQLGTARVAGDDDFDIDDDALDNDPAADTFLEDDEDESDDVSGILGGGLDAGDEDEI